MVVFSGLMWFSWVLGVIVVCFGFWWVPVSFGVSFCGFLWVFRGFPCFSIGLSGVGGLSSFFHIFVFRFSWHVYRPAARAAARPSIV